jgi:hypothetical protein
LLNADFFTKFREQRVLKMDNLLKYQNRLINF